MLEPYRQAIYELMLDHDIDVWETLENGSVDAAGVIVKSVCTCGELLDNDATADGWPAMAEHRADMLIAAGWVLPTITAESTLGDVSKHLNTWKDVGISKGSILYVLDRVYS